LFTALVVSVMCSHIDAAAASAVDVRCTEQLWRAQRHDGAVHCGGAGPGGIGMGTLDKVVDRSWTL
jgi:hypothetical protein